MSTAMTSPDDVRAAFANQVAYCQANNAPVTGAIVAGIAAALDEDSVFGQRVLGWQGAPLADALPLRCAAGFHALHRAGKAPELDQVYAGVARDLAVRKGIAAIIAERGYALLPWLDSPPQTNEAGRSSSFVAALLWLAEQGLPARFALNEVGSSAGINLMLDRYRYDLGGVAVGPERAAIDFAPEWRGSPPPDQRIAILAAKGCDVAPIDLADPAQADRLRAYIWPEHAERFARLDGAIAEARRAPPDIARAHAADFVEAILAEPQQPATTRVLMHSIVWQYVPEASRDRVNAAMAAAGARATPDAPLAWIMLEANRENYRHELRVRHWPAAPAWTQLATAHAHGAWIDWSER
jgi:hypothetical protein